MVAIQRILCPTDFSDFSRRALEYAATLAAWFEAEITVLHVQPLTTAPVVTAPTSGLPAPDLGESYPESEDALRDFVQPAVDAGARVRTMVVPGRVIDGILTCADMLPADLIVAGTHGRSGFERLLLGSVTEKILRKATHPVLTVPRHMPEAAARQQPTFSHILCPVDFSDASLAALEYALALARESDSRLTLAHVMEGVDFEAPVYEHFNVPEYRQHLAEYARERLGKLLPDDARTWCKPDLEVVAGKVYREVLRLADEGSVDLIVMGVLGRNPIDLTLFGSTTHHVVRSAACPVLTIRQPRA